MANNFPSSLRIEERSLSKTRQEYLLHIFLLDFVQEFDVVDVPFGVKSRNKVREFPERIFGREEDSSCLRGSTSLSSYMKRIKVEGRDPVTT